LNLPVILKNLEPRPLNTLIFDGLIVSATAIIVRLIWVFCSAYISRLLIPSIKLKDPKPLWPTLFIIGWSGMRGIVSLAAALSLPILIGPAKYFPHRDLILFLTYCVIVITLITPTITLSFLLHKLNLKDSENKLKQESLARLRSLKSISTEIKKIKEKENIPDHVLQEFCKQIQRRMNVLQTQPNDTPFSTLDLEYQASKRLMLTAITSERNTLLELRKTGEVSDEIFHLLLEELDIEEMRTKTLRV
jgi:CPA1 family monovalent cation:H+ antiporter